MGYLTSMGCACFKGKLSNEAEILVVQSLLFMTSKQ